MGPYYLGLYCPNHLPLNAARYVSFSTVKTTLPHQLNHNIVCGIGVCVKFAHLQMPTDIYAPDLAPWIESTLGAAGLTNVYCTVMIVYHIWRSERDFINMGVPLIPADNVKVRFVS